MCTCVVPYLSHWSDRHLLMRGSLDKQTAEKYIFARHLATRHVSASLLMFYAQAILKRSEALYCLHSMNLLDVYVVLPLCAFRPWRAHFPWISQGGLVRCLSPEGISRTVHNKSQKEEPSPSSLNHKILLCPGAVPYGKQVVYDEP